MHRHARIIGSVVTAVGLAVLASFVYYGIGNYREFSKQKLFFERNPGNAMYELQYRGAAAGLAFMIGGAAAGGLLAVNGMSWLAIGSMMRQLEHARGDSQ